MLAWNAHEAGKIIETYKVYENKPPDLIMGKQESDLKLQVITRSLFRSIKNEPIIRDIACRSTSLPSRRGVFTLYWRR